jgi:hypothetical protein
LFGLSKPLGSAGAEDKSGNKLSHKLVNPQISQRRNHTRQVNTAAALIQALSIRAGNHLILAVALARRPIKKI